MKKNPQRSINIIFNGQVKGDSMGGGDKIVINLAKALKKEGRDVTFLSCPEGKEMLSREAKKIPTKSISSIRIKYFGIVFGYLLRIINASNIYFLKLAKDSIVWSSSDFLPDSFPGMLFKILNKNSKWVLNMFLRARNPFSGEIAFSASSVLSFISQRSTLFGFKLLGDKVFVLSEDDVRFLKSIGIPKSKIKRINGGVDIAFLDSVIAPKQKKYDASFIGRFHVQKGIPDLIYTWSKVVVSDPKAKLAIVGWGPANEVIALKKLITEYGLEKNIDLKGFLDGKKKISVVKNSKVFLFPSTFESWGVVVAEALGSGVPVVSYRIKHIVNNFEKGVIWVPLGNKKRFAKEVAGVLNDPKDLKRLVKETSFIRDDLDWKKSAKQVSAALEDF